MEKQTYFKNATDAGNLMGECQKILNSVGQAVSMDSFYIWHLFEGLLEIQMFISTGSTFIHFSYFVKER